MRIIRTGSLRYMGELLTHYQRHGHWTKTYIHFIEESGNFLKSVSIWDDSIRIKLKRNCFLLMHKDGFMYLVDTIKFVSEQDLKELDTISTNNLTIKAARLMPWKTTPDFLDRLARFFVNPEPLFTMAFNRASPSIVAKLKEGRSVMRNEDGTPITKVRRSDISVLVQGGLTIRELTNSPEPYKMSAKRKG